MLIRSQNKEILMNLENLSGIEITGKATEKRVVARDSNTAYLLGTYSNPQKAIKVLGMIGEAYAEYEMLKNAFGGIGSTFLHKSEKQAFEDLRERIKSLSVFQMPADNEVEA